jgi:nitroreductase
MSHFEQTMTNKIQTGRRVPHQSQPQSQTASTTSVEFVKVVESRRSIRRFEAEPIPPEVMRECLRLAHLAPTSSNLHQWEFYWIRTPELRQKMNAICLDQPAATTAAEIIVCVARTDTWKRNARMVLKAMEAQGPVPDKIRAYYTKLVPVVYTVGPFSVLAPLKWMMFTIAGLFKPMVREPVTKADVVKWAVKSAALACENLMLALRAFGYDTCPMEGFDEKRLKRALGLPSGAHVVMVVGAGRRAEGGLYGPQVRLDTRDFIFEK